MTLLEPGSLLMIFIAAAFTSNILLAKFLGMCSFVAISRSMRTAFCMGVAVVFVTVCTAVLNYLVYYGLLTPGGAVFGDTDLTHLKLLLFILVVAGFVQLVEMVLERYLPSLYFSLGIFLPLITVNCAILGVNLFMVDPKYEFTLAKSAVYALGSSLGYCLAICLMAGIREKLRRADVPEPLRGLGLTLIITGFMALAFMGLGGIADL